MKRNLYKSIIFAVVLSLTSILYFSGCVNKGSPSLYSGVPTGPIGATPKIISITPPNSALAGVTKIIIKGQNFSNDTSKVFVYFNGQMGKVLSSTTTQITVTPPNIVGNSIKIMAAILNSELFSNTINYSLHAAAKDIYPGSKSTFILPYGIASDNKGDIFMSIYNGGSKGVKEITPDSIVTDFAPRGAETFWNSLKVGSDGTLYGARYVRAVFKLTSGKAPSVYVILPTGVFITQLDFDPSGNLWASGKGGIFKIVPVVKTVTKFDFTPEVTALRIFKDGGTVYLYVAALQDSTTKIERFPLDAKDNLGKAEVYYDFSAKYGADYKVNALDFSQDGDMFLGTNSPQPIIVVHPDKSSEALYPAVIEPGAVFSFTWAKTGSSYLYYTRLQTLDAQGNIVYSQKLIKLNIQKPGAPIYQ